MHPVILKSRAIKHYNNPLIARALKDEFEGKEVAAKFTSKFGKRPDAIESEAEVYDFAGKGVTSFHISEETWEDPLKIETGMSEGQYNEIRSGWDLVIDVDAPEFQFCKTVAATIVKALEDFGIRTMRVKFSGNKGFHIGVPFEAFPRIISLDGQEFETKNLFPKAPRAIASLIISYIDENLVTTNDKGKIVFLEKYSFTRSFLSEMLNLSDDTLVVKKCASCNSIVDDNNRIYECPNCQKRMLSENDYEMCPNCKIQMNLLSEQKCASCGNDSFYSSVNTDAILHLDTILISSRHLYRSAYSMHEKSGLCSVVIPKDKIMVFDRKFASPEILIGTKPFLTYEVRQEASETEGRRLLEEGLRKQQKEEEKPRYDFSSNVEPPEEAIKEELWPPCIHNLREGIKDGRKRGVFILINYLRSIGWDRENVEKIIFQWNEKNDEKLREVYIKGQIRHAFSTKIIMPPNCNHKDYYIDIGICTPDEYCAHIKNPAQYALRKFEFEKKTRKGRKKTAGKKKAAGKAKEEKKKAESIDENKNAQEKPQSYDGGISQSALGSDDI